jgi:hypothetical protein
MEVVERAAERVLEAVPGWLWDGERLPVPIEDVVDSVFGLLVCDADDLSAVPGAPALGSGQVLSGLLLADRGEIWVDADEARRWPGRRRFTIGHELGHWCLHRTRGQRRFCRHGAVDPPGARASPDASNGPGVPDASNGPRVPDAAPDRPILPETEEQANAFAAALLMPATLLRREYERHPDFDGLCRRFGVSGAAMGRRLHVVI